MIYEVRLHEFQRTFRVSASRLAYTIAESRRAGFSVCAPVNEAGDGFKFVAIRNTFNRKVHIYRPVG